MKKLYSIFIVLFLALFLASCDKPEEEDLATKLKTIEIIGAEEVMEVGDELKLTAVITPSSAAQEVSWSSSDSSVIEIVDQTGKIKAVGAGVAEIIATSKVDNRKIKKIAISVNEPIVYEDAKSIVFTSTRAEVAIGVIITISAKVLPIGAKQEIVWTSSDDSIATVTTSNNQARVLGKSIGIVEITATVVSDTSISAVFQVSVVEKEDISSTDPTEIIITGEDNVVEGDSVFLTADVLPHGASSTVFWSSEDEQIVKVDSTGKVTGLKQGKTFIIATSAIDTSISKSIMFTVKPLPYNELPPNLENYTIRILASPGHTDEHNPFEDGYIAADREAKQRAWTEIEDLFNCTIKVEDFPTTAPWGGARVSWVNTNAATNANPADIMVLTTQWISQLVNGNSIVDTTEYYAMYGRNQMPAAMKQASTLRGGLYAMIRNSPGSIYIDQGLFYNVNLVKSLGLESPAKLFNDGVWTYSKFLEYVASAKSVMTADQSVLSGKASLYWMGMTNAAGVKLLDTNLVTVNFNNQYARLAANTLREAYTIAGWGTDNYDELVESFTEGKSIFQSGEMWFIRDPSRWPKDMWGEGTTLFGYVPYPRPDQVSKEDTRNNGGDGECYMMVTGVANRPTAVTEAHIYRAWTEVMLRTSKYMEEDPTYNEDVAMKRTAEYMFDDPESLTAATFFKRDKLIFDPIVYGVVGYPYISPFINQVVFTGEDYTQVMDTHIPHYQAALGNLYG